MTDREKRVRLANDWYDEVFKASRKQTIDEVLGITDKRISLLDREHEGDCLVVVRSVLRDLRDEFDGLRGDKK